MAARKTIFITGGGSGIGRAVAQKFSAEGWFVGLADIDEAGLRGTAALLPAGASSVHKLDVRDRAEWDRALAACALTSGGKIDVMFNNAGIPLGGQIIEHNTAEIERCLDINLKGVIFGAQAAYPWLKAAAPGSCLLNTASAAGDLWRGGHLDLRRNQVRGARDHRKPGCRMARRRDHGVRPDASLHRHAPARSCAQSDEQRTHSWTGYRSRARNFTGQRCGCGGLGGGAWREAAYAGWQDSAPGRLRCAVDAGTIAQVDADHVAASGHALGGHSTF